jgi:hypothetical protein
MSDDLLKRLTYFAFKLEGKGQLESAASDAMAEAAERLSAHSTAIDGLRAEIDGLEAELALMKSGFEVAYRMLGDKS